MSSCPQSEPNLDGATAFAGAVAVASAIVVDPGGWFPFSIAKWPAVLVCALAAGACLAWTSRVTVGRRWVTAWTVLVVLVVLSAGVGLDGRMAWFGTPVRHLGALTWMVFGMLFVVGSHVGSSRVLLGSFARCTVVAGGAVGAYASWEALVGPPIDVVTTSARLGGPYGSAAYLGAACCLFLPIALGVGASGDDHRRWRAGALVSALLLALAAVGSGTRGALASLLLSGVLFAGVRGRGCVGRWSARAIAGTATAALGAVLVVAAVAGDRLSRTTPVGSRLDEWALGISALADRPWSGYGPEGYRLVVDRYLSPSYVRTYGDSVLPDRAHNAVLDVALSSGILAAVLYLALLVGIACAAVRLMRRGTAVQGGAGAASVAFITQQQFLFPIAELDAVFWVVAGATVAGARLLGQNATTIGAGAGAGAAGVPRGSGRRPTAVRLIAVVAVILALGAAVSGVRSVAADRLIRAATTGQDADQSIADAERPWTLTRTTFDYVLSSLDRSSGGTPSTVSTRRSRSLIVLARSRRSTQRFDANRHDSRACERRSPGRNRIARTRSSAGPNSSTTLRIARPAGGLWGSRCWKPTKRVRATRSNAPHCLVIRPRSRWSMARHRTEP